MKMSYFIEIQKGSTLLAVLLMMSIYKQWENPTAWVYLALHGSYGFLWILKGKHFPDRQWEKPAGVFFTLIGIAALCLYWIAPLLLTSHNVHIPYWLIAICIIVYIFGIFLHFSADMQKYISLKLEPEHLITTGLWSKTRNPNYLGELLIYLSFATLSMHWFSYVILFIWIFFYWLPNMRRKDKSLSRYPEFQRYKHHTRLFVPFIY
jgi:steroid 5-alpha reductase family enzyme